MSANSAGYLIENTEKENALRLSGETSIRAEKMKPLKLETVFVTYELMRDFCTHLK